MYKNDMSLGVSMVAGDSLEFSQSTPPWTLFAAILSDVHARPMPVADP